MQPCNVHPDERKDCGWIGISRATCESRGCCYDDTIPNTKWCFYKLGTKGMKNVPKFFTLKQFPKDKHKI